MPNWLDKSLNAQAQRKALRIATAARKVYWAYRRSQAGYSWRMNELFERRMSELGMAIHSKEDRL